MTMSDHQAIENIGNHRSRTLDLEQQRRIYTELPLVLPNDDPKEVHAALLADLNTHRGTHRQASRDFRQRMRHLLIEAISEDGDGTTTWNDDVHPWLMKVYNELLRCSLVETMWQSV